MDTNTMYELEKMRLAIQNDQDGAGGFVTFVKNGDQWLPTSTIINRPMAYLSPSTVEHDEITGRGDGYHWRAAAHEQAGGILWEITLHVERPTEINPSMILWLGNLDNMNDRQAH